MLKTRLNMLITILFTALIYVSCQKSENFIAGADFLDRDDAGTVHTKVFYPSANDTIYQITPFTGSSSLLYAGIHDHREAAAVLQFSNPSLRDSSKIDSVHLKLVIKEIIGNRPARINPDFYISYEKWTESTVNIESFPIENYLRNPVNYQLQYSGTDTLLFIFDTHWVQDWVNDTSSPEMLSLIMTFTEPDTGFILVFDAKAGSTANDDDDDDENDEKKNHPPEFFVQMSEDTNKYEARYVSPQNCFLAKLQVSPNPERLILSSGTAYRSMMYFDISELPDGIAVNNASLTLYADPAASWPDHADSLDVNIYPLIDSLSQYFDVRADQAGLISARLDGDSVKINLTRYITNWNAGLFPNNGILIQSGLENQTLIHREFYGSSADSSLLPRLDIFYSRPPSSRF